MATVFGTDGDDTMRGGSNDDTLAGLDGNDQISGRSGQDTLFGGDGDDRVDGGHGDDQIFGGDGNDTLNGGGGQDRIFGGDGNDVIDTGDTRNNKSFDIVSGGDGDDLIRSSGNQDELAGDQDSDRIVVTADGSNFNNLTVLGGEDDDQLDIDTLDLSELKARYPDLSITYEQGDETTEDGRILLRTEPNGRELGRITYAGIERVVICFALGTLIATSKGEVPVQDLRQGDKVLTRDNGMQPIAWAGSRQLGLADLSRRPAWQPVHIKAGALGPNQPERDLILSPNHRLLMTSQKGELYFEENELLAAAKHLVGATGVTRPRTAGITYVHLMFERHEVILSNGAWSESFQPGDYSLSGMDVVQRTEIISLFPELAEGTHGFPAARRALKRHEAKLLLH